MKQPQDKPFVLQRVFGIRTGTIAALGGLVFIQLGFEGIAPLSWDDPTAVEIVGAVAYLGGLTWNGLAYLLERLDKAGRPE